MVDCSLNLTESKSWQVLAMQLSEASGQNLLTIC